MAPPLRQPRFQPANPALRRLTLFQLAGIQLAPFPRDHCSAVKHRSYTEATERRRDTETDRKEIASAIPSSEPPWSSGPPWPPCNFGAFLHRRTRGDRSETRS